MKITRGVMLMLWATFFFALMNVCVRYLPHLPATELAFFRAFISLALSWSWLRYQGIPMWGNNHKMLLLRGLFGTIALITYFMTIQHLPLAMSTMLQYTSPIFSLILARIILKEYVHRVQWWLLGLCVVGLGLMKGFDGRLAWGYLGLGVLSALFSSMAYSTIRSLKDSEHPLVIVFYFPLITIPVAGLWSVPIWVAPQGSDWLFIIAIGVLTQLVQTFITMAYQAEEVSRVAPINYVGIFHALLFGYFIFGETFNFWSFLGMLLIVVGVVMNTTIKHWYKPARKRAAATAL